MLTIRSSQMNTFAKSLEDDFVRRMAAHLRSGFCPYLERQGVADEAVEGVIREGIAAAEGFGVTGEADLVLFVECLAVLAPRFYDDPNYSWAKEILNHAGWSGAVKMDSIENYLLFQVRP